VHIAIRRGLGEPSNQAIGLLLDNHAIGADAEQQALQFVRQSEADRNLWNGRRRLVAPTRS
jgi:hypothetical protein